MKSSLDYLEAVVEKACARMNDPSVMRQVNQARIPAAERVVIHRRRLGEIEGEIARLTREADALRRALP